MDHSTACWCASNCATKMNHWGKLELSSYLIPITSIASYTFSPSFGQLMSTMPVKIFTFCPKLFIEPFFDISIQTKTLLSKCVTHQCKHRKEASLVSKPHGVEFSSWVFPKCRELVLGYVIENYPQENLIVLPLSVFWPFSSRKTVQIE